MRIEKKVSTKAATKDSPTRGEATPTPVPDPHYGAFEQHGVHLLPGVEELQLVAALLLGLQGAGQSTVVGPQRHLEERGVVWWDGRGRQVRLEMIILSNFWIPKVVYQLF